MFKQRWLMRTSTVTIVAKRLSITAMIVAALIIGTDGVTFAGNTASATIEFSVEEMSLMDVSGALSGPITLTAPENGGSSTGSNGDTYIRYTSIVPHGKTRVITASIASGMLPSGCALKLKVADLSGNGAIGNAVADWVYLSSEPQSIVTDIGNCCTGAGSVDGIKITYELVANDIAHLIAGETTTITISFTFE